MTNTLMREGMPTAIILAKNPLTSSLDELRTYNENTIFLNNGNEFQIRLFNPLSEKIGVKIGLNNNFSESYLILHPGQDVILDRFLDDRKKMLFETYNYDSNNTDAQKAIINNGNVTIKFFKEYKEPINYSSYSGNIKISGNTNDYLHNYNVTTSGNVGIGNQHPNHTLTIDNLNFNETCTTTNINLNSTISSFTSSNTNSRSYTEDQFKSSGRKRIKSTLKETGRVEKGNISNQNLTKVDVKFESFSFYEINYDLKPVSEKGELEVREYCPNCGYRSRNDKWNFCPKCGNKL